MLYDEFSLGRRVRGRMQHEVWGFLRSHPLLALALLVAVAALLTTAVLVLFVALLGLAALAAVGFVAYLTVRELLQSRLTDGSGSRLSRSGVTAISAERYLAAVDEFADLAQFTLSAGLDARPRGKRWRRTVRQVHRLRKTAHELARNWSGSSAVRVCMFELEAATVALESYLAELSRHAEDQLSPAALRWQRDDLARRCDTLMSHLRDVDFRAAVAASV